jgi:hypothetical protein
MARDGVAILFLVPMALFNKNSGGDTDLRSFGDVNGG